MDKEFREKAGVVKNIAEHICDEGYVIAISGKKETAVFVKGDTPNMLNMLRKLYKEIREGIAEKFSEEIADDLMKTISMTDEEVESEVEKQRKLVEAKIPAWLRRLMKLEEADNDDEAEPDCDPDEAECEETEEDDPSEADNRRSNRRVDINITFGDVDCSKADR